MANNYASYGRRAGAFIIDSLLVWVPPFIIGGIGIAFLFSEMARPVGIVLMVIALFWIPVTVIWNYVIKQGRTGQTFGKARVGIKLVKEETGQPIGGGYSFLRWFLAQLLGSITAGIFTIIDLIWGAVLAASVSVITYLIATKIFR